MSLKADGLSLEANLPKAAKKSSAGWSLAPVAPTCPTCRFSSIFGAREQMKRYRGFLFDADNTLFDYDRAEGEALTVTLSAALPEVPLRTALAAYHEINAGFWRRFEQGSTSLAELKPGRFRALLQSLGRDGDPQAISSRYLQELSARAYFLPHAKEVVEELSRSFPLALVTNGIGMVQRGRLAKSGVAGCFRAVIISEELGLAKPDPRFFQAAREAISLPANELLCIGDNPISDIEGARAAGIDACWYAPNGQRWPGPGDPPSLVIRDLREILPLASSIFT